MKKYINPKVNFYSNSRVLGKTTTSLILAIGQILEQYEDRVYIVPTNAHRRTVNDSIHHILQTMFFIRRYFFWKTPLRKKCSFPCEHRVNFPNGCRLHIITVSEFPKWIRGRYNTGVLIDHFALERLLMGIR